MKNNPMSRPLYEADPQVASAIDNEVRRQHEGLELIASENFVSEAVLEAMGSVFTNKYAEGYPGKRYYGGCEFADVVEELARDRAKKLFGAEHANVQPHAGSQANMEAFAAVLQPGDTILGLNLAHGGHLTHGHHLNFSGKTYRIVPYGVTKETRNHRLRRSGKAGREGAAQADHRRRQRLSANHRFRPHAPDRGQSRRALPGRHGALCRTGCGRRASFAGAARAYRHHHDAQDAARASRRHDPEQAGVRALPSTRSCFPGMQGGPLVHIIAAKAVSFLEAMQPEFREYARQVVANAKVLAETLAGEGFRIISGGTDTHLMLVDVFSKGMFGSEAEKALGEAAITVNKNAIPFDANPPMKPSGVRIGTPALTTRGMKEEEMRQVGRWISEALHHRTDAAVLGKIRKQVLGLAEAFPLYPERRAKAQAELTERNASLPGYFACRCLPCA